MLIDYVKIARPDHWFKNVFLLPGMLLGWMACPDINSFSAILSALVGLAGTCLIASSNYTINEYLDAETDREHPEKWKRPAASGRVKAFWVICQWLILALSGLALSWFICWEFFVCELVLLIMGIIYNVPPFRSKDLPYFDVISESANNPIRFLLGWYAIECKLIPPVSAVFAYWMLGAFLMSVKRYAEFEHISNKKKAIAYRKSFSHYTRERLLICVLFYATAFAFFSGAFIIRYHLELIFATPYLAGFLGFYLHLGMLPDSPTQRPEKLFKERSFVVFTVLTIIMTFVCFYLDIPFINKLFETTIPKGFN